MTLGGAVLLAYWATRDRSRDVRLGLGIGLGLFTLLFPSAFAAARGYGLTTHDTAPWAVKQLDALEEKDRWFGVLMDLKAPHSHYVLEKAQYEYYKDWYNVAIREMLSFFPYKDDAAEMARRLAPAVPPKKVKQAIELLEGLGLLARREDGTCQATSTFIHSDPDVQSLFIPKFHQSMTRLAEEAITRFPKEERYFSSSTVIRRSRGNQLPTVRVRQRSGSVWSCTTVSIIERGAGSVAVSARPILPCTLATSGKRLMSLSVCCSSSFDLVTLMAGSVVGMKRRSPSSSAGMNSVPSREAG